MRQMVRLRHTVHRTTTVAALLVGTTLVAVPQALAAAAPASAEAPGGHTATAEPLGRLGPLTGLVIERLRVGDDVAASKFGTDSPIEDPVREQQVLEQVRTKAAALGLDPEDAAAFFQDQITAGKTAQKGLFARWTAHPEEAPTTRPDLAEIRERLDRLTTDLLDELKATEALRAKPVACTVQLALAGGSATVRERLDTLHRQALGTATHHVCVTGRATVS
ncbi:chorismate mutase [Streptomyces griseoaurantiacus]|uniref:chorismate mutase n=1 Tax=Streptomyces griseoaurantiacus TaxID=68213 RepID=UPI0030E014C1